MKPELRVYLSKAQDEMESEKWPSKTWTNEDFKTSVTIHCIGQEISGKSNQGRQNDRP